MKSQHLSAAAAASAESPTSTRTHTRYQAASVGCRIACWCSVCSDGWPQDQSILLLLQADNSSFSTGSSARPLGRPADVIRRGAPKATTSTNASVRSADRCVESSTNRTVSCHVILRTWPAVSQPEGVTSPAWRHLLSSPAATDI